jgi:conjugal transfer/type IV secretion protein DotA/TraY
MRFLVFSSLWLCLQSFSIAHAEDFDVDKWFSESESGSVSITGGDAPAQYVPAEYETTSKASSLADIFSNDLKVIPNTDGSLVGACASPAGCENGGYSVRIQRDGSTSTEVIELSEVEAAAFYAIKSTANAGADTEDRDFLSGISKETKLAASILADNTVSAISGDSKTGDLVKEQFLNSTGYVNQSEPASDALVDYSYAISEGDLSAAIVAREVLFKETVNNYLATGVSESEAETMAKEYMNTAYDKPMITGNDPYGILSSATPNGIPSNSALDNNDLVAIMAVDNAVSEDVMWLADGGSPASSSATQTALETFFDIKNKTQNFSPDTNTSPSDAAEILNQSSASIPSGVVPVSTPNLQSPVITITGNGTTGGTSVSSATGNISSGSAHEWVNDIAIPKTDLVFIMLKRLFGGPIESIYDYLMEGSSGKFKQSQGSLTATSAAAPTASLFIVTSVLFIILTMSGVLVSYLFGYGLYKSAKDGELLGKEWNTYWTPARSFLGTAMIFPIPAVSGMSGIQVFVMLCVFFGTAIASTVAYQASRLLMTAPVIDPVPVTNESFVSSFAKGHACMAILATERPDLEISTTSPRELVFDGKGTVTGSTSQSSAPASSGIFSFFSGMFGASKVDPLTDSSDQNLRYETIGKIFRNTGLNPLTTTIKRYQFGETGQCGTAYLPHGMVDYSVEDLNEVVLRNKWPTQNRRGGRQAIKQSAIEESMDLQDFAAEIKADSADIVAIDKITEEGSTAWRNTILKAKYNAIGSAMSELNKDLESAVVGYYGIKVSEAVEGKISSGTSFFPDLGDFSTAQEEDEEKPTYSIASQDGHKNPGALAVELTTAQRVFYDTLNAGVTAALMGSEDPSNSAGLDAVRKLGWMSIGTIYWLFEQRQTELMAFYSYNDLPSIRTRSGTSFFGGDQENGVPASLSEASVEAVSNYEAVSKVIDAGIGPTGMKLASLLMENASSSTATNLNNEVSKLIAGNLIQGAWFADAKNLNVSPIERVRHLGVVVMNGYAGAVTAIALVQAFSAGVKAETQDSIIPGPGFLSSFAESFMGSMVALLTEISGPLLTAAFLCANIIPAMPYIMMTAACVGYLIYVVEALIGSNFWMMMHSHPDGHDIWGKGGSGYPIIFTLILRPLFTVIGFFAGIGLNWVFGHFINITVLPSTSIQNAGGWFGNISQFAGVLAVFSALHVFAAYKSFSLTWELPNALLRWMGVNDHADLGEREAKESGMAIAAPMGGSISRANMSIASSAGSPDASGGGQSKGGNGGGEAQPDALATNAKESPAVDR